MDSEFLKWYVSESAKTAIYPYSAQVVYPILGLVGEIEEYFEIMYDKNIEKVKSEIGDITWYCAAICRDAGVKLRIMEYDDGVYMVVGQICQLVKKWIRDKDSIIDAEFRNDIEKMVSKIMGWCERICGRKGWNMEEIMRSNIVKLQDRMRRGVIGGSGDMR